MSEPVPSHNEDKSRYELHLDGELIGIIDYKREGDVVDLPHTEIEEGHEGKGYAGILADFALGEIRDEGLLVKPTCPYIAKHIERNPEYGSFVAAQ